MYKTDKIIKCILTAELCHCESCEICGEPAKMAEVLERKVKVLVN
jgi:hypothetical protein